MESARKQRGHRSISHHFLGTSGVLAAVFAIISSMSGLSSANPDIDAAIKNAVNLRGWPDSSVSYGNDQNRCTECHQFDELFSHPVDIYPPESMDIPAELPLTNGKVTCMTCHAGSAGDHSTEEISEIGVALASSESPQCAQCHDPGGYSVGEMHSNAISLAHLPHATQSGSSQRSTQSNLPEWLDSESSSCMSCHDGAMASGSGSVSGMNSMFAEMGSEHPIGAYELTNAYDSDGDLTPLNMLDDRVRLFNNQVGCGSCHSLYSNEAKLLVMSNEGSQLCLSCHEY